PGRDERGGPRSGPPATEGRRKRRGGHRNERPSPLWPLSFLWPPRRFYALVVLASVLRALRAFMVQNPGNNLPASIGCRPCRSLRDKTRTIACRISRSFQLIPEDRMRKVSSLFVIAGAVWLAGAALVAQGPPAGAGRQGGAQAPMDLEIL